MNSYIRGQTVRFYCDTYSLSDALTNPTTLAFIYQDPDGTQTSKTLAAAEVVQESTGVHYFEWTIPADAVLGVWDYRWTATGAVKALDEGSFRVVASRLD